MEMNVKLTTEDLENYTAFELLELHEALTGFKVRYAIRMSGEEYTTVSANQAIVVNAIVDMTL